MSIQSGDVAPWDLDPGLTLPEQINIEPAKKAQRKKAAAKYVPTWDEIWITGYDPGSGKRKSGILQMKISDTDRGRLEQVKEALESGQVKRLKDEGKPISKSEAFDLYPLVIETRRQQILDHMAANMPENYEIVTTVEAFERFRELLAAESIVALDTETNGLDCHGESQIVGLCFTLPTIDRHYYIPVAHKVGGEHLDRNDVFDALKDWFEDWRARKVLHNARFDAHMLSQHGIRLRGIHWDTMIAQKILNENEESVALKNLANKYGYLFGYEDDSYTYEQLFGQAPFDEVDFTRGGGYYAAKDGQLTYLLFRWQEGHFSRLPRLDWIYRQIENPLIDVCITMERTGFLIDLEYSKEFGAQLTEEISSLLSQMRAAFDVDPEFNFDSNPQLADLLFNRLSLPDKAKGSVDVKALKFIQSRHAGIPLILEYRKLVKLFGTYVEALPTKIKKDGRLHGSFNQVGTVTGRYSSNDPNLQNLPPAGRRLIIAPEGWVILGSDFSQIEPRVLAHVSEDEDLRNVYRSGVDLYSTLASKVFKVPFEECLDGSKYRKQMKTILLGVMYGLSSFSLAETLKVSIAEAQQFITDFYEAYPKVYEWILRIHKQVKEDEFVETLFGRKRRFPGHRAEAIIYDEKAAEICRILGVDKLPMNVWEQDIERKKNGLDPLLPYSLKREFQDVKSSVERVRRMAVNAIIQGTAADIMKLALIGLHEYTQDRGWALNGTVHDEALTQVPETISEQEVAEMESLMTNVVELAVPLKVDTEIFQRWGDGISKKEWFKGAAA